MTRLVLLDPPSDSVHTDPMAPVTTARPLAEVRAGARLVRERWEAALGIPVSGVIAAERLAGFEEPGSAPILADDYVLEAGTIVALSRFAPALHHIGATTADSWVHEGQVVACTIAGCTVAQARSLAMVAGKQPASIDGWVLSQAWHLIDHLPTMLASDASVIASESGPRAPIPADVRVLGGGAVVIAPSAVVEPFVVFDTTNGAIIIGEHALVRSFSRIAGPFVLGAHSTWAGGSGTTVSIGDHCKVNGEVSVAIFCGHANKGHDGFVGHSYLGRWTNLGAGTVTSNLKNTYGKVSFNGAETTLQFLGSLIGDHAKTGILTRLTTGSCIGAGSNVISHDVVASVVPPFTFGTRGEPYSRARFFETAVRVMARRQVTMSERMRRCLEAVYDAATSG